MLNYIWLSLIVIGIIVAIAGDWRDIATNKYHNNETFDVFYFTKDTSVHVLQPSQRYHGVVQLASHDYEKWQAFEVTSGQPKQYRAEIVPIDSASAVVHIFFDEQFPSVWKDIQRVQRDQDYLIGKLTKMSHTLMPPGGSADLQFNPVRFVKLNSVTNDGIVKYAKTAVELAIGLIGIMALWLGVMKIAEASGLITKIAVFLKPITTRLFPDVPPDHPAMGAMIMNISANILGLANAATPLGLKAMEELNKLNRKLGTATDAMCTFLVINTSNVQLIPATVIAIRASAGSANPTEIIGPVIVATTVSTIVGVTVVKLLAKLKIFRRQILEGSQP
jgi:spore maturation protein A